MAYVIDEKGNYVPFPTVTGQDGKPAELRKNGEWLQWRNSGQTEWQNFIHKDELKGDKGDTGADGREVEMRKAENAEKLQWRLEGEAWKDLIDLKAYSSIQIGETSTGAAGTEAAVANSGTANAAVLNFTIPQGEKGDKGDAGEDGRNAYMRISDGWLQWSNGDTDEDGEALWHNLAAISELKGDKGDKGDSIRMRLDGNMLQWSSDNIYWHDLMDIDILSADPNYMIKSVYDTQNKACDIFEYADAQGQSAKDASAPVSHITDKDNPHEVTAAQAGAVPTSTKVNGQELSSDITLTAEDVGAAPIARTVNGKALSSNITLSAADVSAVPATRTVNGKALSSNITLSAADVGAVSTGGGTMTGELNSTGFNVNTDQIGSAQVFAFDIQHTVSGTPRRYISFALGSDGAPMLYFWDKDTFAYAGSVKFPVPSGGNSISLGLSVTSLYSGSATASLTLSQAYSNFKFLIVLGYGIHGTVNMYFSTVIPTEYIISGRQFAVTGSGVTQLNFTSSTACTLTRQDTNRSPSITAVYGVK